VILGEASSSNYLLGFGLAFAVTAAATPTVRRYALRHGIVDTPSEPRKIHKHAVAYLGGVAIFSGFVVAVLALIPASRQLGRCCWAA
jgi:UDP-GlcNAc:undecaprenyl-phosphate GlcNAc-1-phosphate transferase